MINYNAPVEIFDFSSNVDEFPLISIVTCFNDYRILEANLIKSLLEQKKALIEVILINNTNRTFKSLPVALNYGANKARGKYLLFVHQDVYLSQNWFNQLYYFLKKVPDLSVIGTIGVDFENHYTGFILDRGRLLGKPFKDPTFVQTLDEQLILIPSLLYKKIKFDESFRFHSYVTDYCLTVQELGYKSIVIPLFSEHNSVDIAVRQASDIRSEDAFLQKKHITTFNSIFKTTGIVGKSGFKKVLIDLWHSLSVIFFKLFLKLQKTILSKKIIIDVGCIPFEQHWQKKILPSSIFGVGVSPKKRYLLVSKKLCVYSDYVVADLKMLPFKPKSVDVVFLNGILEYHQKTTGFSLLQDVEEISKEVFVKVPNNNSRINNAHYYYNSIWGVSDFKNKGYKTLTFNLGRFLPFPLLAVKKLKNEHL